MALANIIKGDVDIQGALSASSMTLPNSSVTDGKVAAGAAISADKIEFRKRDTYSQPNTTPTAETRVIHKVRGATGTVNGFSAGTIVAASSGSLTADLKVNGSSILTAPITLDNGNTAYVDEAGTIASPSLVEGDVLTVVIAVSSHNGTGLWVDYEIDETAT